MGRIYRVRTRPVGRLTRNAGVLLIGQGSRLLLQAGYFVLLAQGLGVRDYGAFTAMLALTGMLAPFSTFGAINLMIKDVAVDGTKRASTFATTTRIAWLGGAILSLCICLASPLILPPGAPWWLFACIAIAEILFSRLIEVSAAAYQATEAVTKMALLQLAPVFARFLVVGVLTLTAGSFSLAMWCFAYVASTAACALLAMALKGRGLRNGERNVRAYLRRWREGVQFSISLAAQSSYNDIDKAMLGRLGSLEDNGAYSAAYRLIEVAFAPMRALLGASYPRFFSYGSEGIRSGLRFAGRLAPASIGVCIFASLALYLSADWVPWLLGEEYRDSAGALRGLAVLPVLRGIQYLAADTLTGAGLQGSRSAIQVGAAILNIAMNAILIPLYSWRGAIISTLVCEVLLAVSLWIAILMAVRKQSKGDPRVSTSGASGSERARARR
jgi:O-antigen/teichoic acid export membrane protein